MIAPTTAHAILIASILATSTSFLATTADAFQSPQMPSVGSTASISIISGSELGYVVVDADQEVIVMAADAQPITTTFSKNPHGYAVANHDNERSFWLQALQNLESDDDSSQSSPQEVSPLSLWTRIACAFAPSAIRENYLLDPTTTLQDEAYLVRVGDTDLDIAVAVPEGVWKEAQMDDKHKKIVQLAQDKEAQSAGPRRRNRNQHTVTIRIDFPEGSSFDKDAYTFEDELDAVIRQVRLLERNANDRLSGLQMAN